MTELTGYQMTTESWSAPGADDLLFAMAMDRMLLYDYNGRQQPFRNLCYFTDGDGQREAVAASSSSMSIFVQWT